MALVADGLGFHIPKGYIYFSAGCSLSVQALVLVVNARRRSRAPWAPLSASDARGRAAGYDGHRIT